jgi:hypothetical protein
MAQHEEVNPPSGPSPVTHPRLEGVQPPVLHVLPEGLERPALVGDVAVRRAHEVEDEVEVGGVVVEEEAASVVVLALLLAHEDGGCSEGGRGRGRGGREG